MKKRFSIRLFALGVALGAIGGATVLAVGSYAGTAGYGYPPGYASAGGARTAARAVVGIARSRLGRILVDGRGRTLYLFERDKGMASTCYGACASVWPPLTTAGKHAVRGALGAKLGTTRRSDGKVEVTYNGHPLYLYLGDAKPGNTNGQGLKQFGGGWDVLSPKGAKIEGGGS